MLIARRGRYDETCEKCGKDTTQDYGTLIRKGEHGVVFICDECDTRRVGTGNESYLPPALANLSYEELPKEKGWALVPDVPYTPLTDDDIAELFKPGWQDMAGLAFIVVGIIAFGFLLIIAEGMQ